jgi:hypothetical protein
MHQTSSLNSWVVSVSELLATLFSRRRESACLVGHPSQKSLRIIRHIESLDVCMEYYL